MANGRFISKSISTSEQLAAVSLAADYLFTRCIPHLDVDGRLMGSARWIKSQIVPLRDEIPVAQIPALLEELSAARDHLGRPLIVRYEVGGREFLSFPGFVAHQQGLRANREAPSKIPAPPPEPSDSTPDQLRSNSGATPELLRTNSRLSGREVKGREAEAVRAREDESEPADPAPQSDDAPPTAPLSLRDEFLRRYYADAPPARRADVERQLVAVLSPSGCRVSKHERAVATEATLEKALQETLVSGAVRVPDKAIVILLRKLVSGRCNETPSPGRRASPPPPAHRASGACRAVGDILAGIPSAPSMPPPAISSEERTAALCWVSQHPQRLEALETWADIEAARAHPRWHEYPRMAAVRARNLEEAIVAAFRSASAVQGAEASSFAGVG